MGITGFASAASRSSDARRREARARGQILWRGLRKRPAASSVAELASPTV
jgi:hypothetical protein